MSDIFGRFLGKQKRVYTIPKKKLDLEARSTIRELREILNADTTSQSNTTAPLIDEVKKHYQSALLTQILPELNGVTQGLPNVLKNLIPSSHPLVLKHLASRLEVKKAKAFFESLNQGI